MEETEKGWEMHNKVWEMHERGFMIPEFTKLSLNFRENTIYPHGTWNEHLIEDDQWNPEQWRNLCNINGQVFPEISRHHQSSDHLAFGQRTDIARKKPRWYQTYTLPVSSSPPAVFSIFYGQTLKSPFNACIIHVDLLLDNCAKDESEIEVDGGIALHCCSSAGNYYLFGAREYFGEVNSESYDQGRVYHFVLCANFDTIWRKNLRIAENSEDFDSHLPFNDSNLVVYGGFYFAFDKQPASFSVMNFKCLVTPPNSILTQYIDRTCLFWRFIPDFTTFSLKPEFLNQVLNLRPNYTTDRDSRFIFKGWTIDGKMVIQRMVTDSITDLDRTHCSVIDYSPFFVETTTDTECDSPHLVDLPQSLWFEKVLVVNNFGSNIEDAVREATIRGISLMKILQGLHHFESTANTVALTGGAIRDLLEKNPINDFDLVVASTYSRVKRALGDIFGEMGESLSTSTLRSDGITKSFGQFKIMNLSETEFEPLDIALFKAAKTTKLIDCHTFGVTKDTLESEYLYGWSYHHDAQTRDYTINALYYEFFSPVHVLIDPTGTGYEDIMNKRLRIVNPENFATDIGAHFRFWKLYEKYFRNNWSFVAVQNVPLHLFVSNLLEKSINSMPGEQEAREMLAGLYFPSLQTNTTLPERVDEIKLFFKKLSSKLFPSTETLVEKVIKFDKNISGIEGVTWWTTLKTKLTQQPCLQEIAQFRAEYRVTAMVNVIANLERIKKDFSEAC